MAITVIKVFTRKGHVRVIYYNYDDDDALADTSSVAISIVDPDGNVDIDEGTMDKTDTGVYEYYYPTTVTSTKGDWQIEVDALDGTYHSFFYSSFTLRAGINE